MFVKIITKFIDLYDQQKHTIGYCLQKAAQDVWLDSNLYIGFWEEFYNDKNHITLQFLVDQYPKMTKKEVLDGASQFSWRCNK